MSSFSCYACIKTNPAKTEILIEINTSGEWVERILAITTDELYPLKFDSIN